jgi:hypothetical protein
VYFYAPTTGLQHVFVSSQSFYEKVDDDGEVWGYDINDPTELYAKIAEKFRRETLAAQTAATGLPPKTKVMDKIHVSTGETHFGDGKKKKKKKKCSSTALFT